MISNIRLQQFRSYADASFEFEPGVNIIVGPNASGKTNLLEAILVMARGKSYRGRDQELVQYDRPWARIDAEAPGHRRTVKLEWQGEVVKKSFEIDGKQLFRLVGNKIMPVVVFEPNHLLMLSGSPEQRRTFLDELIEQTTLGYATLLRHYKRALAQRNALLKSEQRRAASQLFAWDVRLSELGAQIVLERHRMLAQINQRLAAIYSELAQRPTDITASYSNATEPGQYASYLLKKLEKHRELDMARGFTGAGPHREDMVVQLHGQLLTHVASRGEARTALLALKIIELHILEQFRDERPLLLLDDVFSELDGTRRHALTEFMRDHQTFITTTDADVVAKNFTKHSTVILLEA